MELRIRVGLMEVEPQALGFQMCRVHEETGCCGHSVLVYTLYRSAEPLVVVVDAANYDWEVQRARYRLLPLEYFANAYTPDYDYPTKPFINAMRTLLRQMDYISSAHEARLWLWDAYGLLVFSLRRREASVAIDMAALMNKRWRRHELRRIEWYLHRAEKPAPFLGNRVYIEIARTIYEHMRIMLRIKDELEKLEAKR